jgi:hypothetical protein
MHAWVMKVAEQVCSAVLRWPQQRVTQGPRVRLVRAMEVWGKAQEAKPGSLQVFIIGVGKLIRNTYSLHHHSSLLRMRVHMRMSS